MVKWTNTKPWKVITCPRVIHYITWVTTKSLSLRIYTPHKRISSQIQHVLPWYESYQRWQNNLILLEHWNDVTQKLNYIGRRERYFSGLIVYKKCFVFVIDGKQKWKGIALLLLLFCACITRPKNNVFFLSNKISLNNSHIQEISIERRLQNLELKTRYKTMSKVLINNKIIIFY